MTPLTAAPMVCVGIAPPLSCALHIAAMASSPCSAARTCVYDRAAGSARATGDVCVATGAGVAAPSVTAGGTDAVFTPVVTGLADATVRVTTCVEPHAPIAMEHNTVARGAAVRCVRDRGFVGIGHSEEEVERRVLS